MIMKALEHRIPPPVLAAGIAAAMWLVASPVPWLTMPEGVRLGVALVIAALGIAFDLSGLLAFRAQRTTVNPMRPHKASALVTHGVYSLTRNPMYVGLALLLLAWAVRLGAPWPLAGPPLFVLYISRFQIGPEERALEALFGDEYRRYAARVRRWL
jgi:protein-S-isoprenylcysteine O-methyltransferase Ste14